MTWRGLFLGWLLIGALIHLAHGEELVLRGAMQDHPHIQALLDGRKKVQGCDLQISTRTLDDIWSRIKNGTGPDLAEVEVFPFIEQFAAGETTDYILIPVFLSREFQLRNVYIRTDRGIRSPTDLRGKKIGVSGYASTAPAWVRGTLQSSWSIKPEEITWLDTETAPGPRATLSDWLLSGKVDAILTSVPPRAFVDKNPKVDRLFPDYRHIEYERFKETRVFPIITALALRRSFIQENAWLPEALFIAFSESKKKAYADRTLPPPWGDSQLEETQKLMGKNFWSYGIQNNPKTLGALFRFAREQGLLKRPLQIEDVFEPSTQMLLEN
jgi:4,5-dihydroxyphthalate decarboxylase